MKIFLGLSSLLLISTLASAFFNSGGFGMGHHDDDDDLCGEKDPTNCTNSMTEFKTCFAEKFGISKTKEEMLKKMGEKMELMQEEFEPVKECLIEKCDGENGDGAVAKLMRCHTKLHKSCMENCGQQTMEAMGVFGHLMMENGKRMRKMMKSMHGGKRGRPGYGNRKDKKSGNKREMMHKMMLNKMMLKLGFMLNHMLKHYGVKDDCEKGTVKDCLLGWKEMKMPEWKNKSESYMKMNHTIMMAKMEKMKSALEDCNEETGGIECHKSDFFALAQDAFDCMIAEIEKLRGDGECSQFVDDTIEYANIGFAFVKRMIKGMETKMVFMKGFMKGKMMGCGHPQRAPRKREMCLKEEDQEECADDVDEFVTCAKDTMEKMKQQWAAKRACDPEKWNCECLEEVKAKWKAERGEDDHKWKCSAEIHLLMKMRMQMMRGHRTGKGKGKGHWKGKGKGHEKDDGDRWKRESPPKGHEKRKGKGHWKGKGKGHRSRERFDIFEKCWSGMSDVKKCHPYVMDALKDDACECLDDETVAAMTEKMEAKKETWKDHWEEFRNCSKSGKEGEGHWNKKGNGHQKQGKKSGSNRKGRDWSKGGKDKKWSFEKLQKWVCTERPVCEDDDSPPPNGQTLNEPPPNRVEKIYAKHKGKIVKIGKVLKKKFGGN